MNDILIGLIVVLMVSLLLGLTRVVRGPTRADRMLAAQLFGTTGVALMLLLGVATGRPALFDVALVMGVLAPITAIAFVHLAGGERR